MKLAVMQPYLFPYLGYFQMIYESDKFIIYDSVDYIQRGFVNRNQILSSRGKQYFTVPVKKSKLGTKINEVLIDDYIKWKIKFLKQIKFTYSKAPNFNIIYSLIKDFLDNKDYFRISDLASDSLKILSKHFKLETEFVFSSDISELKKNNNKIEKLEYILTTENASAIVLPPGSKELYQEWQPKEIDKKILALPDVKYSQFNSGFVNHLSIIDVLMFNSYDDVLDFIKNTTFQ